MNYELYHHGTLGMRWGVRRYQNKDGSLKPAGEGRYDGKPIRDSNRGARKIAKKLNKIDAKLVENRYKQEQQTKHDSAAKKELDAAKKNLRDAEKNGDLLSRLAYKYDTKVKQINYDSTHKQLESLNRKVAAGEAKTKAILSDAKKSGYKIDSAKIDRLANVGEDTVRDVASWFSDKNNTSAVISAREREAARVYRRGTQYRARGDKVKMDTKQMMNRYVDASEKAEIAGAYLKRARRLYRDFTGN